jgi:hypothetical protein
MNDYPLTLFLELTESDVDIESQARTVTAFIRSTAEWVEFTRVPSMNGYKKHIGVIVEDTLSTIAMAVKKEKRRW